MSKHELKPTTTAARAEMQRRCDWATPAPWEVGEHGDWHCLIETGYDAVPLTLEDYRLAALARTVMPRLLADVERLEKQVEVGRQAAKMLRNVEHVGDIRVNPPPGDYSRCPYCGDRGPSHGKKCLLVATLDICREAGLLKEGAA